jgi:hypothetical protein
VLETLLLVIAHEPMIGQGRDEATDRWLRIYKIAE